MRPLKFKRYFKHVSNGDIYVQTWGRVDDKHQTSDDLLMFKGPALIPGFNILADCQFTGLHDKNGKEIYEGNVVQMDSFSPSNMEVRFDNGGFCLSTPDNPYMTDIHYVHHAGRKQATIIGNIYENPDLITSNPSLCKGCIRDIKDLRMTDSCIHEEWASPHEQKMFAAKCSEGNCKHDK